MTNSKTHLAVSFLSAWLAASHVWADTNPEGVTRTTTLAGSSPITNNGTISTSADNEYGMSGRDASGNASLTNNGAISTSGAGAHGMRVRDPEPAVSIVNNGQITTAGASASGIRVQSDVSGVVTLTNNGTVKTDSSTNGHGIYLTALNAATTIHVTNNGAIYLYGGGSSGGITTYGGAGSVVINNYGILKNYGLNGSDPGYAIRLLSGNNTVNLYRGSDIVGAIYADPTMSGNQLNISLGLTTSYRYALSGAWASVTDTSGKPAFVGANTASSAGLGEQVLNPDLMFMRSRNLSSVLDQTVFNHPGTANGLWISTYADNHSRSDRGVDLTPQFKTRTQGAVAGLRRAVGSTVLNSFVQLDQSTVDIGRSDQTSDTRTVLAGLHGLVPKALAGFDLSAQLAVGYSDRASDRKVYNNSQAFDGSELLHTSRTLLHRTAGLAISRTFIYSPSLSFHTLLGMDWLREQAKAYSEQNYFSWAEHTTTLPVTRLKLGMNHVVNSKMVSYVRLEAGQRTLGSDETYKYTIQSMDTSYVSTRSKSSYSGISVGFNYTVTAHTSLHATASTFRSSNSIGGSSLFLGIRSRF